MTNSTASSPIQFLLNGNPISVDHLPPQTTLLDFVRAQGLTGAKEGCAEGECGACMVAMVSDGAKGCAYRAVNSCLMFLPMAAGQEIYTVESLAEKGELAQAQKAMAEAGGSQCGYCTPGFVVSLFAEQYRPDRKGLCDIHELSSNLCRCTGYRPIRDAAWSLGAPPAGTLRERLQRPAPAISEFHHQAAGARFSRPETVKECISILAADPRARLIAGGTDMAVESNLRHRRWSHLISIEAIHELREFSENETSVRLGAGLPLNEIGARWSNAPAAVREWLPLFASPALRNRATLGGNLATASPIGDGAPLLAALDAVLHVAGPAGPRMIPIRSFFTGYRKTALAAGELLTAIEIPKPFPALTRFYKVAKRRMDDISAVAAAFSLDRDPRGVITRARFAFGGVAETTLRVGEAEDAAVGHVWNEAAVERVQRVLARTLKPISDHRASAEYRLEVAQSLIGKFWWEHRELAA